MSKTVRIYLDTQDFSKMYKPTIHADLHQVKDTLISMVNNKEIEIGISFLLMSELLQDCTPEHKNDRFLRAKFIKTLCGSNAFSFMSDLNTQVSFSSNGSWMPQKSFEEFSMLKLSGGLRNELQKEPSLDRNTRRHLKKDKNFKKFLQKNPSILDTDRMVNLISTQFPISKKFLKENVLQKYILGSISESQANELLRETFTNPELFFLVWYGYKEKNNILSIMITKPLEQINNAITEIKKIIKHAKNKKLKLNIDELYKKIRTRLENILPSGVADTFAYFVSLHINNDRGIKKSDIFDILHTSYLPYCDLFRCDVQFYNILKTRKMFASDKVVPRLLDLPNKIEELRRI